MPEKPAERLLLCRIFASSPLPTSVCLPRTPSVDEHSAYSSGFSKPRKPTAKSIN